jgi:hypothetical protein
VKRNQRSCILQGRFLMFMACMVDRSCQTLWIHSSQWNQPER